MEKAHRSLLHLTEVLTRRESRTRLQRFKPYPKQLEFYAAGRDNRERLLLAANQVGKTYAGAMETAMHLTGLYPEWWPGHRFDRPINAWAGSDTSETTRDTVQTHLMGPPPDQDRWGTGTIPGDSIIDISRRQGVADAIDTVVVRHVSGGASTLGWKSYDQGRHRWQGKTLDFVWMDEEPPLDIYTEALTRTNAVDDGRVMLTFTPLQGVSEVVLLFLGGEV